MSFAAPWLLLALAGLPLLWWLLRVIPPMPRPIVFPAVRLLLGLPATNQTSARTPLWLLVLRLLAAALVVVGLARPGLHRGTPLPGRGPVLLVMDNGWASAPDWEARMRAADRVLARAAGAGRQVALLATAPGADASPPALTPVMAAADLSPRLAVLRPQPWPVDRGRAAAALAAWHGTVAYIADGLTDGAGWPEFAAALDRTGPVLTIADPAPPAMLLLPATAEAGGLAIRAARVRSPLATAADVLARTGDGRTLARLTLHFAAGAAFADATLRLPLELRNQIDRLDLMVGSSGLPGAGGVVLLDESARRRPVGLLDGDQAADTPLSGANFFLRRALSPYAEIREGNLASLLSRPLSVLISSDQPLAPGPEADQIEQWVRQGGVLLRFAGPSIAQGSLDVDADPLLPVPLLTLERQLGGVMSWESPASLAPFSPPSPFLGLSVPDDVRISRQVLADPSGDLTQATWARLTDGTPLVTQRPLGAGRIVLFHVTANADWSNLPLSGLFVDMLRRLVALSAGVAVDRSGADAHAPLVPQATLDGAGVLGPPPPTASPIDASVFASTHATPTHPPGLYGPENARRALNLSATLDLPEAAPAAAGGTSEPLSAVASDTPFGPYLLLMAVLLLIADLLASLRLRGLLTRPAVAAIAGVLVLGAGLCVGPGAQAQNTNPALATRLAFVQTGDSQVDDVAQAGLAGLSAFVNSRTAAVLADPAGVEPGRDDLSFYPLLYWPITIDAPQPGRSFIAALNDYMAHGGIILIDTRDGGSGADMAPGTRSLLRRLGPDSGGLDIPPLAPLTAQHVLAHAFYLLSDFPGRYDGDTVWVGRDQDRSNDSVSPVIVGGNDWAAAWAVDAQGRHPYATLPGGDRQRTLAYRFGTNVVMYALTGNYKGDQVHVPALLERLGQ